MQQKKRYFVKKSEFYSVERELNLILSQNWNSIKNNSMLQLKMKHNVGRLQRLKLFMVVNKEIKQQVQ